MKHLLPIGLACILPLSAMARDAEAPADEPRLEAEFCFPGKELKKELSKFEELKASKRDTVGAMINLAFILDDGELPPERVEIRDGSAVEVLALRQVDNQYVTRNLSPDIAAGSDAGQLCVIDPAREGRMRSELGYRLQTGFNIRYLETPGTHTVDTLKDGLKDGRSHWKKMVGAMGFMMPKFDHIAVAGDARDNPPAVTALKDGAPLGTFGQTLEAEVFDGAYMIPLETLEELGADAIRIDAPYYRMTPSPDAKTVARFMGGGGDSGEGG